LLKKAVEEQESSIRLLLFVYLESMKMSEGNPNQKRWMVSEEAATYCGVEKQTLYEWVRKRMIPHCKPPGSRLLLFDPSELDEWIKSGRVETITEISD